MAASTGPIEPDVTTRLTRPSDAAFVAASIVALLALIVLSQGMTFWHDDWALVQGRLPWTVEAFMAPHNEHWILTVVLLWKPLLEVVGLHSYIPYLMLVFAAHVATAAAVYFYLRRQIASPALALAAGIVFLFLGAGGQTLFHGTALNLVGSTAAGTWAVVLFLVTPRLTAVAALLVVSIMTAGTALFFIAAIAVGAVLRQWRQLWVVAPALVTFGAWTLVYGRGPASDGLALTALPAYMIAGLGHSFGALTGTFDELGLVLAIVLIVATVVYVIRTRHVLEGAVVGVVGLVAQFGLTGVVRAQFGAAQAEASRYVYTAAVFILIAVGSWLSLAPRIGSRRVAFTVAAIAGWMLVANLAALWGWREFFLERAHETGQW